MSWLFALRIAAAVACLALMLLLYARLRLIGHASQREIRILVALTGGPLHPLELGQRARVPYGLLYGDLYRLEQRGQVHSWWDTADREPRRRLYALREPPEVSDGP